MSITEDLVYEGRIASLVNVVEPFQPTVLAGVHAEQCPPLRYGEEAGESLAGRVVEEIEATDKDKVAKREANRKKMHIMYPEERESFARDLMDKMVKQSLRGLIVAPDQRKRFEAQKALIREIMAVAQLEKVHAGRQPTGAQRLVKDRDSGEFYYKDITVSQADRKYKGQLLVQNNKVARQNYTVHDGDRSPLDMVFRLAISQVKLVAEGRYSEVVDSSGTVRTRVAMDAYEPQTGRQPEKRHQIWITHGPSIAVHKRQPDGRMGYSGEPWGRDRHTYSLGKPESQEGRKKQRFTLAVETEQPIAEANIEYVTPAKTAVKIDEEKYRVARNITDCMSAWRSQFMGTTAMTRNWKRAWDKDPDELLNMEASTLEVLIDGQ